MAQAGLQKKKKNTLFKEKSNNEEILSDINLKTVKQASKDSVRAIMLIRLTELEVI